MTKDTPSLDEKLSDKEVDRYIGRKIREFREEKGLKQVELAEMAGLNNRSQLQAFESAAVQTQLTHLFAIAKVLEVEVSAFFPKTPKKQTKALPSEETIQLARAINEIPDDETRKGFHTLIRSIHTWQSGDQEQED